MRPCIASVLFGATLQAAQPAAGQNALTLYGGYRGGGSFEQVIGATTSSADIAGSGAGALSVDWALDAARNIQLFASAQRASIQVTPASPGAPSSVPLNISYAHLGGSNFFDGSAGQGGYIAGGLGATVMSPKLDGLGSEIRPSMSIALGYEYAFSPSLALRAELRGYATLINSSGALFCSGGCVVVIRGDTLFQADALLGLSLRF